MYYEHTTSISEMLGATLVGITGLSIASERVEFEASDGRKWVMYHSQDCCESVLVEDITGEVIDLLGHPLTMAEEVSNFDLGPPSEYSEDYEWTFYKLATVMGYVTIRWLGESNGFYGTSVDFARAD